MRAALAEARPGRADSQQRRRDGTDVELDMAIAPLRDAAGAIVGSVAVARDISRERALEAQLAQAQRMEAVGRLAGGSRPRLQQHPDGHQRLRRAGGGRARPTIRWPRTSTRSCKASDRAAALTRALLAFSRRQVMQPQRIDLNEVVAGLTPMLGPADRRGRAARSSTLDPELGLAMADGAQLEQVVLNLAVNARDAMPDGGTLTIATANADLDAGYARTHVGACRGRTWS